ncbi:hypothetical protein LIA77_08565 [Sarocladium implicatum]|nr:hypothetical protein LIA77_08565 [Sarocladium implicatum]
MRLENEEDGDIEGDIALCLPCVLAYYCRFLMLEGRYQYRRFRVLGALLCSALEIRARSTIGGSLTRRCAGCRGVKSWTTVYTMV